MKRIINNIFLVLLLGSIAFGYSCDALNVDDYFEGTFDSDSIFANRTNLERYFNGAVGYLPDEGNLWNLAKIPGVTASDEAVTPYYFGWGAYYHGTRFMCDQFTSDDNPFKDMWTDMYIIIRKVNLMLSQVDDVPDMIPTEKTQFKARCRFLRAYAYYNLLTVYGPCILMGDDVLSTNERPEYYATQRATYDEYVDYICEEFEEASQILPMKAASTAEFGAPTMGAALALVARLRLEQASPFYNGGGAENLTNPVINYFKTWTRKGDGVNYISQQYSEEKWARAAQAAYRVIKLAEDNNNLYALHTVPKRVAPDNSDNQDALTPDLPANVSSADFPYGAGNIDPLRSYADIFNGEALETNVYTNPEMIFTRMSSGGIGEALVGAMSHGYGGYGVLGIPQKIVDQYYMADGRDIYNSSEEYPYSEPATNQAGAFSTSVKKFSSYTLNSGVYAMYLNREPRFYASIGFSESYWYNSSTSSTAKKMRSITYYASGGVNNVGINYNQMEYPLSGYVLRKYLNNYDAKEGNDAKTLSKNFPIIRYAEILMIYVEALNNLTTTHTIDGVAHNRDTEAMAKYFNMIRYRAGLPGLTATELQSTSGMNEIIKRERLIEFLHENRRYFDLRRWGIVGEEEAKTITGMDVTKSKTTGFYTRVVVDHRVIRERNFQPKMVYVPIPLNEMRKVTSLDQNPGWQY